MTSVTRNQCVLRSGALSVGLCALMVAMAGCGRDTTQAEPDPAKVSVEINPGKPGLNKPLGLPHDNKGGETKGAAIVAEPVSERGAKASDGETSKTEAASAKPDREVGSETAAADVKSLSAVPLKIKRLVVTTEIEKREPVEVSSFEAGGEPIYAFMELENPGDDEQQVMLTFEHSSGRKVGLVELKIPAKQRRWRTWGRTQNIKQGGDWEAIVKSADGQELARTKFHVSETKAAPAKAAEGSAK